jgi:hemin uptake protein HemP
MSGLETQRQEQAMGTATDKPAAAAAPPLPSDQLLQGRRVVEIAHNGEIYRLQATRLGKLILTK